MGEKYKNKTAFGSVYKQNLSRNIWQVQIVDNSSSEDNQVKLALHHKKSNFGSLKDTIGLMSTFGESFTLELIEIDSDFTKALSGEEDVYLAFKELGEATGEEVAAHLQMVLGTVKNQITKLKKKKRLKDTGRTINRCHVYSTVTASLPIGDCDDDAKNNGMSLKDAKQIVIEEMGAPF